MTGALRPMNSTKYEAPADSERNARNLARLLGLSALNQISSPLTISLPEMYM